MPRVLFVASMVAVLSASVVACGRGQPENLGELVAAPLAPATPFPNEDDADEPVRTAPAFLPRAAPGTRAISFLASDETRLVGRLFGDDKRRPLGVLLLHSAESHMGPWFDLAQRLMEEGYVVFAMDFRGYGQSDGDHNPVDYPRDVEGALDVLRIFGAGRVAIVGSEVGGTAALGVGDAWSEAVRGVVVVDSGPSFQSLDVRSRASNVKARTLVLSSERATSELARVVPDARLEAIARTERPWEDPRITSLITDFIGEAIGRP